MINKALKIFFPLLSMCLTCSCSNTGANQGGNMNKQPELYEEVYDGKVIYNEPIILLKENNKLKGKLLYHPSHILKITDYTGQKELDFSNIEINDREISFDLDSDLPYFPKEFLNCETSLLKQLVKEEPFAKFNLALTKEK